MAKKTAAQTWTEYVGARLAAMLIGCFDIDTNLRTGQVAGRILNHFDRKHRDRCEANIRRSMPEWSEQQIKRCAQASIEHLVQLALEVVQTPRELNDDSWQDHIVLHELGPAINVLNSPEPCIMLTGHLGNWEILGFMLALLGYDMDAVARPLDNPKLNEWVMGIREQRGMRIITKFDATERMLGVLDAGNALGFTADQNAGDKGMFVPFFGKLASTYKSIGLLALKYECPVICGYAHRIGPGFRYEVGTTDIIYPDQWADQPDPLYYITARYCRAIELMVRLRPQQYFWMHRRWKSRPRHERLGKPMPAALRRNIEQLPWSPPDIIETLERNADAGEQKQ